MITDNSLIQGLVDLVSDFAKPVVIAFVIGFLIYTQAKPRLEQDPRIEL